MDAPRTHVMGILNITDDSFSDGGRWLAHDLTRPRVAIDHARDMIRDGATIIDIGGESTRPGAVRVTEETELRRVIPVIEALADDTIMLSVDTMRATVARRAIDAGATLINDVSGGLADSRMIDVAADTGVRLCIMHWETARFGDADSDGVAGARHGADRGSAFVRRVVEFLQNRAEYAIAHGVDKDKIILDPGIGFAKSALGNWSLLHSLDQLTNLGYPILVGVSRKRFLTSLVAGPGETPTAPNEADNATAAVTALAALHGAWAVRVHNVRPNVDAVAVAHAWATATGPDVPRGWRARHG
ncbi:dihydropteroate synthase [Corynebacterium kroppenstedtii]|uniref:dihydropteroate synthase n=1 Tax=Corynebacterium sp. PCR 32 TaxID=3351342 RepID=UPI003098BA7F